MYKSTVSGNDIFDSDINVYDMTLQRNLFFCWKESAIPGLFLFSLYVCRFIKFI